MLKYASLIAPLLLKRKTPNPVSVLTGYVGAFFLLAIASLFLLAALFVWTAQAFGLDAAFLAIGVLLCVAAFALIIRSRVTRTIDLKKAELEQDRISGLLAAHDDPLSDHIPDAILTHPLAQRALAEIENKPWIASLVAIAFGWLLAQGLLDEA